MDTYRLKHELPMGSVRWNIALSSNTDQSVRMYLAAQGGGRKGDLSRFIEEAVRSHILELSAGIESWYLQTWHLAKIFDKRLPFAELLRR